MYDEERTVRIVPRLVDESDVFLGGRARIWLAEDPPDGGRSGSRRAPSGTRRSPTADASRTPVVVVVGIVVVLGGGGGGGGAAAVVVVVSPTVAMIAHPAPPAFAVGRGGAASRPPRRGARRPGPRRLLPRRLRALPLVLRRRPVIGQHALDAGVAPRAPPPG